jgi:threonine dehydratase
MATFPINFAVMASRGMQGVVVSEAAVRAAQAYAFARLHLVIEPGGAAALAAVMNGQVPSDGRTAVILSGGNVDPDAFAKAISCN